MSELTVEEMISELGQMMVGKRDSHREKVLCRALEDAEIIVEDDGMGNGWRVLDDGGMPKMPQRVKHFVWSNKGYAWVYWMGMKMPYGHSLVSKSDPVKETDSLNGGKPVDFSEVEIHIESKPTLKVVR